MVVLGSYWNLVLLCGWLHPTQWPVHSAWTALQMLAMCQCMRKHRYQAPADPNTQLRQEHRVLCSWCCAGMAHTESALSLLNPHRCGMRCTYVHLRIEIDLSNPLLHNEHNSHANSMQQILQNSSGNELIFFASPPYHTGESLKPRAAERKSACKQEFSR